MQCNFVLFYFIAGLFYFILFYFTCAAGLIIEILDDARLRLRQDSSTN